MSAGGKIFRRGLNCRVGWMVECFSCGGCLHLPYVFNVWLGFDSRLASRFTCQLYDWGGYHTHTHSPQWRNKSTGEVKLCGTQPRRGGVERAMFRAAEGRERRGALSQWGCYCSSPSRLVLWKTVPKSWSCSVHRDQKGPLYWRIELVERSLWMRRRCDLTVPLIFKTMTGC